LGWEPLRQNFAAEAYGEGDQKREAEVIWTATAIAGVAVLTIAVPLVVFSYPIVRFMNVREHLFGYGQSGLEIATGSFVLGIFEFRF